MASLQFRFPKNQDLYIKNITNFYEFYVVSNDNQDQCNKQIKLIEDSKVFLRQLNTYNPEIHKSKPEIHKSKP